MATRHIKDMDDKCRDGTPCMSTQTCKAQDDGFCLRQRGREKHQEYVKARRTTRGGEEESET